MLSLMCCIFNSTEVGKTILTEFAVVFYSLILLQEKSAALKVKEWKLAPESWRDFSLPALRHFRHLIF